MSVQPDRPTVAASGLLLILALLALAPQASSYHEETEAKPTVTILDPGEGSTVEGQVEVMGEASAEDTVHHVEVQVDGGEWVEAEGRQDWTYSWDTTVLDEGSHELAARSFDGMKYSDVDRVNVTVQNGQDEGNATDDGNTTGEDNATEDLGPTVAIESPPPEAELNGTVVIRGTASSEAGDIQQIEVQVDDEDWRNAEGTTSWSYEWNTSEADGGEHEITVRAIDTTGNTNETTRTYEVEGGGLADIAEGAPEPTSPTGVALLVVAGMAGLGLVLWARS